MRQTTIRKASLWSLAILLTIGAMYAIVWNGSHPSEAVKRQHEKLNRLHRPGR